MPHHEKIASYAKKDNIFGQVLAGKISVQDFFSNPQYNEKKNEFMRIYENVLGKMPPDSLYSDEHVAAAWIAKLRYNENMSDQQFKQAISRSAEIFSGQNIPLNLRDPSPEKNDLCAIMWGIEALNGTQSFDSGATRVRLPPGVAPQIVKALETAGSVPRTSTHATCTKLVDQGLGKDLEDEKLRQFTPRGMGALLVIPTSADGSGTVAKASSTISSGIQQLDYDLLLKREDYGFNDTAIHTHVHSKAGFINYMTANKAQYQAGMNLINCKSTLAKEAENQYGKGKILHRKEHLSELKGQSAVLVDLLEAGKKQGLFNEFKTAWTIRIKWPPFEKKIVSDSRKGLGDFLRQLADAEKNPIFAQANVKNIDKVRGLLDQANGYDNFSTCREGNEVLVNCQHHQATLVDTIAKDSTNDPVDRTLLQQKTGMISETDLSKTAAKQQNWKAQLQAGRESLQEVADVKSNINLRQ